MCFQQDGNTGSKPNTCAISQSVRRLARCCLLRVADVAQAAVGLPGEPLGCGGRADTDPSSRRECVSRLSSRTVDSRAAATPSAVQSSHASCGHVCRPGGVPRPVRQCAGLRRRLAHQFVRHHLCCAWTTYRLRWVRSRRLHWLLHGPVGDAEESWGRQRVYGGRRRRRALRGTSWRT